MKIIFALFVALYLLVALIVSEMVLIRYVVRCEVNRFVHAIVG